MMYSTKTALVIRADLSPWQVANVAAFLSGGLADGYPEIVGEPYRDGDGRLYTPMIREPVFIYGAASSELSCTHRRAINRGIRFAIYTEPSFKTSNDADSRQRRYDADRRARPGWAWPPRRSQDRRQDHRRPQIPRLIHAGTYRGTGERCRSPGFAGRRSHRDLALLRALNPRTGPLALAHFRAHIDIRQL